MSAPSLFRTNLPYSLDNLLNILEKMDVLTSDQVQAGRKRAREDFGFDLSGPDGMDNLLKLGLAPAGVSWLPQTSRLTEELVVRTVAKAHGLEFKRIDPLELDLEVSTRTISESFARRNMLVPIRIVDGLLEIVVYNPFRPELWEDMERVTHLQYRVHLGTRADITRLIDEFYQFQMSIKAAESEFKAADELGNLEGQVQVQQRTDPTTQRHIIKAVNYLMRSAIRERASDIHLEPKRNKSLVRMRIDGILHTVHTLPMSIHQAIINRLKGLSRMDIAEKRRPQDGRIQLMLDAVPTDVRVSTIPVAFGEKMVLRLLSSETTLLGLDSLGMTEAQRVIFDRFLASTHGLVLVTGPTGSGKSTTLYSTLKALARPEINLVTIEDPIEMVVEDFNQIGIQTKAGITFGQMLRHILRQDPDIVMVGEMRDLETAEQAVQAALTGHLVFSTLHTNDAVSAITRLRDLGVEAYLLNASIIGSIAQRLVRTICPSCKVPCRIDDQALREWGVADRIPEGRAFRGTGCEHCRRTGFHGRLAIFEIIPFDSEIKEAVRSHAELAELRALVRTKKIPTLFQAGMDLVRSGTTTFEEVLRVASANVE
ncbi:MAG: type II/IV secretion system protein [Deltaproteobacteria bacterium]|nr:type II/IV secretion system protein [Deltaproteobacteria bacterium]